MNKRKYPMLISVAILSTAMAATACGSGGSTSSEQGTKSSPAISSSAALAPGSTPANESISSVTIALDAAPPGYNPEDNGNDEGNQLDALFAGTLTKWAVDSNAGGPNLAQRIEVSQDGLTWTFVLRPNLRFSDGTSLTSADVKATLDHIAKYESFSYPFVPANWQDVQAPAPDKVTISLKAPDPSLPIWLSVPYFAIFPAAELEKSDFFDKPISAGPYMYDTIVPGGTTTMKRNPYYWGTAPTVDSVKFTLVPDPATRLAQVQTGQANLAFSLPGALIPQLGDKELLVNAPGNFELIFNNDYGPLKDPLVRQAISYAIDRDQLNAAVWNTTASTRSSFWPTTFSYFKASPLDHHADIQKAKSLLAASSCASGCSFSVLYYSSAPWARPAAAIIQQDLKAIGITMSIDPEEKAVGSQRLHDHEYQAALATLLAASPKLPLHLLTNTLDPREKGGMLVNYKSGTMSGLIDQITAAKDSETQAKDAANIEAQFQKDQPWVPLADYYLIHATNVPKSVISYTGNMLVVGQPAS